jgi:hypothetical protein
MALSSSTKKSALTKPTMAIQDPISQPMIMQPGASGGHIDPYAMQQQQ